MRSSTLRLIVGAGIGVGLYSDPFAPSRLCAAGRHPRRDPDGHPNGGGGTDGGGPDGGQDDPDPDAGGGNTPAGDDWASTFEGLTPAQVKEALEQSRKWESRAKENHKKVQQYDQLAASFNGGGDGAGGSTPPSPEQLATELTTARSGERAAKIESAVMRAAITQKVDPDRLTDSRRFMSGLEALELAPAADDFASKVDGAVKAALEADKSLAVGGGSDAGWDGYRNTREGGVPGTPPSLDTQIADAESKGDVSRAVQLKALKFAQQSQRSK